MCMPRTIDDNGCSTRPPHVLLDVVDESASISMLPFTTDGGRNLTIHTLRRQMMKCIMCALSVDLYLHEAMHSTIPEYTT